MDRVNKSPPQRLSRRLSQNGQGDSSIQYSRSERRGLPWRSYLSRNQREHTCGFRSPVRTEHNYGQTFCFPPPRKGLEPRLSTAQVEQAPAGSATSRGALRRRKRPSWLQLSLLMALLSLSGFALHQVEVSGRSDKQQLTENRLPPRSLSATKKWQNWKDELIEQITYLERDEPLVLMLKRYGLTQQQSSDLVLSIRDDVDLTRLRAEDPIPLLFRVLPENSSIPALDSTFENPSAPVGPGSASRQLVGFRIANREKTVGAYLYQGQPKSEIQYHELAPKTFSATVQVNRSLFQDGIDVGIPGAVLLDMFNRYSFDINFQSDIQRGTRYELAYTMIYNEQEQRVGTGDILYANIILSDGRSFPIFKYTDLSGKSQYFNPKGSSINKALLLMPVNGAYVSSRFGYRRDPILGTWRLHRGTDYAAPMGTPIKAGGTGRIIARGWSRVGYGYHIIIRHANGYDTLYGHMSRFQSGYRVGSRVRQGDIIGYVGSTGKSTGPHVHYEVRRYGKPIGLKSLRLQANRDLKGIDLQLFESGVRALQARFQNMLPDLQQVRFRMDLARSRPPQRQSIQSSGVGGADGF